MSKYIIIDIETNITEKFKRKANFKYAGIVAIGYKKQGENVRTVYQSNDWGKELQEILQDCSIMVAHNAKFELLHFWKYPEFQEWLASSKIFCTQLSQYILSGQRHKYPALRDIAVNKYGCSEREKKMEKYWEKGIDTKDIPKELVLEDVRNDVLDTEAVMLQQVKLSKKEGMFKLIMLEMDSLLATTEMEYNGIYINKETFEKNKKQLEEELKTIYNETEELANRNWK